MTNEQLYELAERLAPLAGMAYHGGTKTAKEWRDLTGSDPDQFPTCIQIHRSGLCSMLPRGAEILAQYFAQRKRDLDMLCSRLPA